MHIANATVIGCFCMTHYHHACINFNWEYISVSPSNEYIGRLVYIYIYIYNTYARPVYNKDNCKMQMQFAILHSLNCVV